MNQRPLDSPKPKNHSHVGQVSFLKPGPMSLLQDQGRKNAQRFGFAQSGAMDQSAFDLANKLLNNPENSAAFEVSFGPVALHFSQPTRIAITGAADQIRLDGKTMYPWSGARIDSGSTLFVSAPSKGIRTYIAIQGGIKGPAFFGSVAQTLREHLPSPLGGPIKKGECFEYSCIDEELWSQTNLMTPFYNWPDYGKTLTVRVRPCYQFHQFSEPAIQTLLSHSYEISPLSDRMGYQLKGPAIQSPPELAWSEGIAMGSIQIPPNGQPIVLLRDRQSIGGYPKIGTLHEDDCNALSQRRPGQSLRFVLSNE